MMKWRVQGKSGCSARKSSAIRSAKRPSTEDSEDVRASLDFLDKVIAEYNGAENGVAPAPEDDAVVAKPAKTGADEPPPCSDKRPDVSPHERFSVNLVIVNDVVKELPVDQFLRNGVASVPVALVPSNDGVIKMKNPKLIQSELKAATTHYHTITEENEDDATPPPVPKRPPPSLPRSSSTGSVTSARDYPVSPPPRRRYLSPERRRRALMMNAANGASASTPDSPDALLGRRPFQRSVTELQAPFDQKSVIPEVNTRPPAEQTSVTAVTRQSDSTSAVTLLRTGRQPTYVDSGSPNHLNRVDSFGRDDGWRGHATSAGEFKPYLSPPVETRLPKEFAALSSPMEVSRALVGCRAVDASTSSSAEIKLQNCSATKEDSLRRQAASPICSRAFFYSTKQCALQRLDESTKDVADEVKLTSASEARPCSPSPHNNQLTDIAEGEIHNISDSPKPDLCANNGSFHSENGNVVRVVNGGYSPNETTREKENARLTVTFRTLPETGSFRRKCESRNSIHVDLNVRDGLPWNGRTQSSASSGSGDESSHAAAVSSSGLCRSRSLRSHRKLELSDGVAASRAMEDFLPPPLPPRKTKEDARRQAEESASPTLKRVTFHILPTTHENSERKEKSSSAEKRSVKDSSEDGFFTRPPPKTPSPVVLKGRAPSPTCHRATNGSPVVAKIKEPSPQGQRRLAKVNGVQGKTGPRDAAKTPGHPTKEAVVKKTFEPPSAASDVSTDCYNVYNVRTGKISSTVTKPNALGRSVARVPQECPNGTRGQLTKLRNISPTREAEKLIGKIISRCKSSAVLNGKDRNKPASPPPPSADGGNAQPQLLKLTARQQQRHSRCTKCVLAQAAK